MARHFHPLKIVMAYRLGHGKSTYRCTTSAQCHGTKKLVQCRLLSATVLGIGHGGGKSKCCQWRSNRVEFQLDLVILS